MEHCVFDMLRLDNISGLDQERVRIFYKDNAAIVEGIEEEEVNKVSYNILGFEENVCHTQIHLNHGTVMLEFLTRQNVQMYINDMLRKISVTCRWELNSDNTAIEVYVYGKNRLKEALETIQNSFCVEEIVSVEKSLVCHLWKTALWKAHIKKLKERLNNKVEYEQSETADKIIVIYTQDLEKVAIDNMHQIEQNLEADIIYKPTDEAFKLLSNIDIEPIPSVTYTILKEHQCILFDGDEGKIQKARLTVRKTARTIKVEKISVHPMVPLSFFRTTTFLTMLNKALESKKLRVFWEVNDTDYSVDVFAFDDQMKETVNVVKQSYCLEKFEFADDVESLEHFKANIRLLEKGDKLICIVDNQTVIVVCTSDLIAQVTEVRKECENVSITMNVFCKESAVYKFIAINKVHLAEIEEKYSVSISPIDDKCTFVIKGKKDKLPAARDSLTGLMNQKISKESMQVGEPRFLKFENGEYETVCQEFEKFSRVLIQSSETAFDDVGLNVDDSDIILTNRRYKPELESKTAVMVARDGKKNIRIDTD